MNIVQKILKNNFNREWTQSNVKICWVWKSSTRDLGTRKIMDILAALGPEATTALQTVFFSNWNFLQNNTRFWVFAQQQYSFRFNTNELSTNKHVNKSGYTTEYRLKVSLERHYCSVLETEIRVWREVINHNQSTYTSHLAPDNSRLPHYSPLC